MKQREGGRSVAWTDEGGNQEAMSVPVPYGISPIPGVPRRSSRKLYREGNSTCQNEHKEGGVGGLLGWIVGRCCFLWLEAYSLKRIG